MVGVPDVSSYHKEEGVNPTGLCQSQRKDRLYGGLCERESTRAGQKKKGE